MEDHLRERDRLATLGLLAGGVAHDLNNPLAVISAHAQLLLRRADDEATAGQLREILDAVERCHRIAADLLAFARRQPVERRAVDVGEVVRGTLALTRKDLEAGRIRVSAEIPEALPLAVADPHQLRQVFLNVVLNAGYALRERGSRLDVSVAVEEGGDALSVRFANDGPPIPPEALPHIFDPFFTTKPEDEGTGLGLAICRRIVQEHGGEITVESDESGTAFTIRLPVETGSSVDA
jgi:two-component system NtrC family sensor kinase